MDRRTKFAIPITVAAIAIASVSTYLLNRPEKTATTIEQQLNQNSETPTNNTVAGDVDNTADVLLEAAEQEQVTANTEAETQAAASAAADTTTIDSLTEDSYDISF